MTQIAGARRSGGASMPRSGDFRKWEVAGVSETVAGRFAVPPHPGLLPHGGEGVGQTGRIVYLTGPDMVNPGRARPG